jgi:RimJ/RimL family protein N-acetyltransferase
MLIPIYPIRTARLDLRPFEDDDLLDLYAFHSLPDVARYLYWEARTLEETRTALERKQSEVNLTHEGSRLTLAVVIQETARVIGEVSLTWQSVAHQQAEVGYLFHPEFQGRGYATEAVTAIMDLGFASGHFHRIYGRCDGRNVPSYRLMARLGMRREAHFIHNEIFKGEWGDELYYAILQTEWQKQPIKPPDGA